MPVCEILKEKKIKTLFILIKDLIIIFFKFKKKSILINNNK